ncbi:MAG: hypothetical protein C4K58_04925 [Flavobacteriaceae bacterium]|nr:MAG: hypothetical protein C4K58_04925 [Flavobacteriaceae bacterium]
MSNAPLAERMRPKKISDFVGQSHLLGENGPIVRMIKSGVLSSFILWGPPGIGKTSLAEVLSLELDLPFIKLSAINSGVKDIRDAIEQSQKKGIFSGGKPSVLFIDEIHRFNKSQQDSLLEAVEKGWICLIGATTENPSFEVVSALLSRAEVLISAFIKSIRGSNPDAAVYWLARMIAAGEKETFIARRMLILASEDIGGANPTALVLANATFDAVQKIGFPESRILLSQCAIYLANSPKSNASYLAINAALECVKNTGNLEVPLHLRNPSSKVSKEMGYGKDYKYPHNYSGIIQQQYLPQEISSLSFYSPGDNLREKQDAENLRKKSTQ